MIIRYYNQVTDIIQKCHGNQLTELDVTKCLSLEYLECEGNRLSGLDVSKCSSLETLGCYDNQLSKLDLTNCTQLTQLYCDPDVTVIGYTEKRVNMQ